jgi:hypothetical protein
MQTYACHVHVPDSETPHVRFLSSHDPMELADAVRALLRQWPDFELVEIRDAEDRIVSSFDSRTKS